MKRSLATAFALAVLLACLPMAQRAFAVEPITYSQTVSPKAKINDLSTVTSTITVPIDLDLTGVQVTLNIRHSRPGDLVISLTSPSGTTVVISNRDSAFDLKGTVDLTEAFKGKPGFGEWTLTVEDQVKKRTGALNSWTVYLVGVGSPPPLP